ncbi:SRPBCC domain-containing protein [Isoptericola nanjingensis]|uniref:SRPBCC domain-containing protein n=1 Tax=Isoptericola TaxID=254250 RepID=UPI0035EED635|nr:SRPBCC domain-containing protein [Isoptericola sp. QY 916]
MTDEQRPAVAATGTVEHGPGGRELVVVRRFDADAADVWASITEPGPLEAWVGRWEGDPATGTIQFFMTAESADAEAAECVITRCEPPRGYAVDTAAPGGVWHLALDLSEDDGVTTLTFRQRLGADDDVASIGPGWEYYLDRLVAVRSGRGADSVAWESYYPAQREHYARAAAAAG